MASPEPQTLQYFVHYICGCNYWPNNRRNIYAGLQLGALLAVGELAFPLIWMNSFHEDRQ